MVEKKVELDSKAQALLGTEEQQAVPNETLEQVKKYNINRLALYFGDDYIINDKIVIRQPTINDFVQYENEIYGSMSLFLANPTTYRLQLWEAGVDWNDISDFEFFAMMCSMTDPKYSQIVIKDIDFSQLKPSQDDEGKLVMSNEDGSVIIDEDTYMHIAFYIRYMFNSFPKVEKAKGKGTKKDIIYEEKVARAQRIREGKTGNESTLLPLISFCLNHPGFKYKKDELRNVGIVEFMDSVSRLQVYETTSALYKGMYSGFVDTKKINKDEFNFMRDLTSVNA